eukprot:CAMPEP_0198123066 /NCGR_PEP_ID=MMETSP1442-20131203/36586_1 /TAXON_ID= /ORGANISM="Craspedostauros australis, Strain CCMP3328" /LENGTH=78 /DNA_ID=CAMNT_0043782217 /DNA_START=338 /DNA_END=571 /DNA_ORIENTATION=+
MEGEASSVGLADGLDRAEDAVVGVDADDDADDDAPLCSVSLELILFLPFCCGGGDGPVFAIRHMGATRTLKCLALSVW